MCKACFSKLEKATTYLATSESITNKLQEKFAALSDATYRGCLYKAVMRFMTSPKAPTAMAFVNEIHTITTFMRPLKRVAAQVGLYEGLRSNPL